MKRTLKRRHYGRYVDDYYVVSSSRRRLMLSVPEFTKYGIFNLEYRKYYLGV